MSLQGTIGDFGISDIFQLVGHQGKTGVLLLKNRELEVKIYFVEGNVVKAQHSLRDRADLLGNMMVRAGVITEAQLEDALGTQQRTLRRLGDVLIETGATDRATLKEFARLQTTETIYRLFLWKTGTYEFTAQEVDYDEASYEPIRAENILMEGFRIVDEWPAVRKQVPNAKCSFTVLKEPAAATATDDDDDILSGLHDALGGGSGKPKKQADGVSQSERRVFSLVAPGRTAQDIVDVSRLGEFETHKALAMLVKGGYLKVVMPSAEELREDEPVTFERIREVAVPGLTRLAFYAVVAAAVGGLVRLARLDEAGVFSDSGRGTARRAAVYDTVGHIGLARLKNSIEVFQLREGRLPRVLDELVDAGLIEQRHLAFPYEDRYLYVPTADGSFSLALPLR